MQFFRRTWLCFLIAWSSSTFAQVATQERTLVVNEHSGDLAVLHANDSTYVDLNRLVQIGHGTVAYQGNRILVMLPGPTAQAPVQAAEPETDSSRLSHDFVRAGIEEVSLLREWASALASAIENGYPIAENWVVSHRNGAQKELALASAAVSTNGDRDAFQLLKSEFQAVQDWSNKLLEAQKSMSAAKYAVSDSALRDDPLSQKIVTCGRFLGQMLANGSFQDEGSCH